MAWSTVRLTGRYLDPEGNPESGRIEFRVFPSSRIRVVPDSTIVVPDVIRVDLDDEGRFEIDIPSTNDPDIQPSFRWHVRERFLPNRLFSYLIEISHEEEELDISDLEHITLGAPLG